MVLACSLYPDNSITNAMVQIGSNNKPYSVSVVSASGQTNTKDFTSEVSAVDYAKAQIAKGASVNLGLLQIPQTWLGKYPANMDVTVTGVMRPCKNMFIATEILNNAMDQCSQLSGDDKTACALSIYHSGSPTAGLDYAKQVIAYAAANPFVKPPSVLEQVSDSNNPVILSTPNSGSNTDNSNTANNSVSANTNSSQAIASNTPDNSTATDSTNQNYGKASVSNSAPNSTDTNSAATSSNEDNSNNYSSSNISSNSSQGNNSPDNNSATTGAPVTDLSNGGSVQSANSSAATSSTSDSENGEPAAVDPSTQNTEDSSTQDPAANAAPFMPANNGGQ